MAETTAASNMSHDEMVQQYYDDLRSEKPPATVICAILFVIALLGNSLTLYVFKFHYKKGKYRYFVFFLTLADLFSCLIAIPLEMMSHGFVYPVPPICKIKAFLWAFTLFSKPACLTVIAVDMFSQVLLPQDTQMTQAAVVISCFIVYIVALLLALPVPISWTIIERDVDYNTRNIKVTVCDMGDLDDRYEDRPIDIYLFISCTLVAAVLMFVGFLYVYVNAELNIWKREIDLRSKQKRRDACGTEAEIDTRHSIDDLTAGNIGEKLQPCTIPDRGQSDVTGEEVDRSNQVDASPSTGDLTAGNIGDNQQPCIVSDSDQSCIAGEEFDDSNQIDTCPSTGDLTAANISDNQQPFIVSDNDQSDVTGEKSGRTNSKKKEEDVLNMIYWAKPKAKIMACLSCVSFIITFMHVVVPASQSNGIVLSLNFINYVVNPLVFAKLDLEYRHAIVQLWTNVKKCRSSDA